MENFDNNIFNKGIKEVQRMNCVTSSRNIKNTIKNYEPKGVKLKIHIF